MKKEDLDNEIAQSIKEVKAAIKNKPKENYRIVHVDYAAYKANELSYKPQTIKYFIAANDEEAYNYLLDFKKSYAVEESNEYFWMHANTTIGSDGKYYDDILGGLDEYKSKRSFWQKFSTWWYVNVSSRVSDFWYKVKDILYWLKTKHNRVEQWEIFSSMMEVLEYNLPKLIEHHTGVPSRYCVEARKQLHANEPDFDLEKSLNEDPNGDEKELELATKLYVADLEKLLLNIRLLNYYSEYGIIDEKNPVEVELKKKYSIPYIPGGWQMIDYKALAKLEDECNAAVFDQLKDMGRCLWD